MKCEYYNVHNWCEPPIEPGENGTLVTEYQCKKAKGYFNAMCDGDKELCNLKKTSEGR